MWSRDHDDADGDDGDELMMVIMMTLCRLRMRSGGRQLYMVDAHKKNWCLATKQHESN